MAPYRFAVQGALFAGFTVQALTNVDAMVGLLLLLHLL